MSLWDAAWPVCQAEGEPVVNEMSVYKVDDGVDHWVIASSKDDARSVWSEHLRSQGMSDADIEPDVDVEVFHLTQAEAEAVALYEDDPSNQIGTMGSDFLRDSTRRYMGCSEW